MRAARRKSSTVRGYLAIMLFAGRPALAALDMHEGLWETTVTADGRTQWAGTQCYTRADIDEMEKMFHGQPTRGPGACRYSGFSQSGNTVTYTMSCRLGDDEQTGAVTATYHGDSASGTIRANGVTVSSVSRRLGDCSTSSFAR
jgi:hypothetical protein